MKTRILLILALMAVNVMLFSCKEEQSVISNDNPVEIDAGSKSAIRDFINQVNGVTTRWDMHGDNYKNYKLRLYVDGAPNCTTGNGSCLPELILVAPSQKVWESTAEGKELQEMVSRKQVTLNKDFNQTSNTQFYIYKGVKDTSLEIVVPVVYK